MRAPAPGAKPPGTAAAHQRYIEREGAAEESDGTVYSRGTIGEDTAERAAFWNTVEARERADGLVQCRVIAELPHEASVKARRRIADSFLAVFTERGLPGHVVIHRPDGERAAGAGDPRNVHLHLVYHDRPTERMGGQTSFAERKDREARGPRWIRHLRARYAVACNRELAREGCDKRYHPGSYASLGIDKVPQRHLGPVMAAFERQGRVTRTGAVNLVCEREWERRQGLQRAHATSRVITGALSRLIAAPPPLGLISAPAWQRYAAKVAAFAAADEADADGIEPALSARDAAGRRRRAERLRAYAERAQAAPRCNVARRRRWAEVERTAARFLEAYHTPPAARPGRSLERHGREAAACERRFHAARLMDRRAQVVAALDGVPATARPSGRAWQNAQLAAQATAERAAHQAAALHDRLAAGLAADLARFYVDGEEASRNLARAVEAGQSPGDLLRLDPAALGPLRGAAAPPVAATDASVRRLLAARARARERAQEAEAVTRSMMRTERPGHLDLAIETPGRARAQRRERRRRLAELDAIDLAINANPTALRLAVRAGLAEEVRGRARAARRRQARVAQRATLQRD